MRGTHQDLVSASKGTYDVNDTTPVTDKEFVGIDVASGTVISELEVNGVASNVVSDYISTPATAYSKNTLIVARGDDYFSKITLGTAGQATLILG